MVDVYHAGRRLALYDEGPLDVLRTWWLLRKTPTTPVARLVPGTLAKVVGEAQRPDDLPPLMAPFSGRACVATRVVGMRLRSGNREDYELIDDVEHGNELVVGDESGRVRVERRGWSRLVGPTRRFSSFWRHESQTHIDRWIAAEGAAAATFFDGWASENVYDEQVVEVGARVTVLGMVVETELFDPGASGQGYRASTRWRALVPPADSRLLIAAG